jgi:hypothetical protein
LTDYVPGTEEKDPKKVIMALQQAASSISTAQDDINTNTADIATANANIATNTSDIASNTAAISSINTTLAGLANLIPSGTLMLFQQTSAPTGWTKQTTHNDKALRVVSGTASSGGTNAFSTVMAQTTVGGTALTISQIPSHTHAVQTASTSGGGSGTNLAIQGPADGSIATTANGSGATHNHTITMSMAYVDIIIASKN